MNMKNRWMRILTSVALVLSVGRGQTYPRWFLDPAEIGCGRSVAGFSASSYYADSAISRAAKNARENYAREKMTSVIGGQLFWATENGNYWMGSDFVELYDTAASETALANMEPADSVANKGLTLFLLVDKGCKPDPNSLRKMAMRREAPAWTESPTHDPNGLYAVGVAPEYYYEVSSWLAAERNARRNLARSVVIALASVQKVNSHEGQDLRREQMSVNLHSISVAARWRDYDKKIFFVLIRAPREVNMR